MKVIVKILTGTLVIALLGATALYFQDSYFWQRYYLLITGEGVLPQSGWDGAEFKVEGNHQQYFSVAPEQELTIAPVALEKATSFAGERKSTSLFVWHKGKLQLKVLFGDTQDDTLIVGKSMAKMVAGIVIGRAIKDGYIAGLDEPAATYINEWQDTEKSAITIRHLLNMAAGFEKYYTLDMSPFSNFTRSYIAGYTEDVIINGYQLVDQPGTVYDYSQAVSDLLALIIERATKKPYGQYLSEALIQPIGAQGGEVMMNRPEGLAHSGCCLLLPAESWLRIGLFLLKESALPNDSLFPENWMKEYLTPSPANPAMGLHIWLGKPYYPKRSWTEVGLPKGFGVIHSEPYLADDLFMFDGSGNQVIYIIPSKELVIVRTGGFSWTPGKEWDNAYLPNTIIRGIIDDPETMSNRELSVSEL